MRRTGSRRGLLGVAFVLAILGLITYPTLLAGSILDMFNVVDVTQGIGMVALVPGALFEFILPVWLLVKGFKVPDRN